MESSLGLKRCIGDSLRVLFKDRTGSATIEFTMLAIPLFIPLMIFASHFSQVTNNQDALRTLARESARAFVTSSDDQIAFSVAREVVSRGAEILGIEGSPAKSDVLMNITCSESPCISPNSRVLVKLTSYDKKGRSTSVSVIEYVSPWA
ncbi:MAG: pilus assembly protein [Actinobacteria bacterium]|nr:pilus assembly protein [Actinomycetota bacterium]